MSDSTNDKSTGEARMPEPIPDSVPETEQMLAMAATSARDFEIFTSTLDLGDDRWPERPPARGVRLRWPTAILFAVLLGGAGLWLGAFLQRGEGSNGSSLASFASALSRVRGSGAGASGAAARLGAGSGAGGLFGRSGARGAATVGTVTEVAGTTLYVTNASGALVKVTISASTSFTRTASINENDLRPGDTVVVVGSTQKNGSVNAASVAATAQGLTPAGIGGGGGLGG